MVTSGGVTDHVRRHHNMSMAQLRDKHNIPSQSHNEDLVMHKAHAACKGQPSWNKKYENRFTEVTCHICGDTRKILTSQLEGYRKKGLTRFTCGKVPCANKLRAVRVKEARSTPQSKAKTAAASKRMWATGDRKQHIEALIAGTHSYNTKPELVIQGFLRESEVPFITHYVISLPQICSHCVPDIVIGDLCVFMDGCYYHHCPECDHLPPPNFKPGRDASITATLISLGYRVLRIWEHELKSTAWQSKLLSAVGR